MPFIYQSFMHAHNHNQRFRLIQKSALPSSTLMTKSQKSDCIVLQISIAVTVIF